MSNRRAPRLPTEEELQLWSSVTRNDERLARDPSLRAPPAAPAPEKVNGGQPPANAEPPIPKAPQALPKPAPARPAHAHFDQRKARQLSRGRQLIDARLDLHGLKQDEARASLRHFLYRCQASGYRNVLIITGKGSRADSANDAPSWEGAQRGVLRRLVPIWLADPEFQAFVIGFTRAAINHGGEGALYVAIRKPRAARKSS